MEESTGGMLYQWIKLYSCQGIFRNKHKPPHLPEATLRKKRGKKKDKLGIWKKLEILKEKKS